MSPPGPAVSRQVPCRIGKPSTYSCCSLQKQKRQGECEEGMGPPLFFIPSCWSHKHTKNNYDEVSLAQREGESKKAHCLSLVLPSVGGALIRGGGGGGEKGLSFIKQDLLLPSMGMFDTDTTAQPQSKCQASIEAFFL